MMAVTGLRKVSIALAVAVGALACAGRARAQEPRMVPVEISATQPGSHIWVRGRGREFRCGEGCVLQLPAHDYRVFIRDPEGHLSATALNISSPTSLTVSPGNHPNKMLGIGLFAGGLAGVTAGGVLLYLSVLVHSDFVSGRCSPDCSDVPSGWWYAGGISMAAGLALGAAGLIIWKANAHPAIGTRPLDARAPLSPARGARMRLAPAAGRQWAGLRLTGDF